MSLTGIRPSPITGRPCKLIRQTEYRIALERAMLNASRVHFDTARQLESKDQLDAALLEVPPDRRVRSRKQTGVSKKSYSSKNYSRPHEAARPKPAIVQLRSSTRQQRRAVAEPGVAGADRLQLQASESARHSDVPQQRNRHQRHLRRQLHRPPRDYYIVRSIEQALNTLLSSNACSIRCSTSARSLSRRTRRPTC